MMFYDSSISYVPTRSIGDQWKNWHRRRRITNSNLSNALSILRHIKRKGKGSDAVVWQTSLNNRQCLFQATQRRFKTFDYTTIVGRLRMVSCCDNSHATGVVNLKFKDPTFPLPAKVKQSKGQTNKNIPYPKHVCEVNKIQLALCTKGSLIIVML